MGIEGLPTSPEPGGHTGGSRRPGRRGAPGPAMGGFTVAAAAAAAGTFHHCLRGALCGSINLLWLFLQTPECQTPQ